MVNMMDRVSDSLWQLDSIHLAQGENRIGFWVRDQRGRDVEETLTLHLVDRTPPRFAHWGNASGDTVPSPNIGFYFRAADEYGIDTGFVRLFSGETLWARPTSGSDSAWLVDMSLGRGTNAFFVTIRDENGNDSTTTFTLVYNPDLKDVVAPDIEIKSPADSLVTRSDSVWVEVEAIDVSRIRWVRVDGDDAERVSDIWRKGVKLGYGPNWIRVQAADSSEQENIQADSVLVFWDTTVVDTTPPFIQIKKPADGSNTTTGDVACSGTADDYSGIDTVFLVVGSDTVGAGYDAASMHWSGSVRLSAAGQNRIFAVVRDRDEKPRYALDSVVVNFTPPSGADETPPRIELLSHTHPDTVTEARQRIRVKVTDVNPVTVAVNGESASKDTVADVYYHEIALAQGKNEVRVAAEDSIGNKRDTLFYLVYEDFPARVDSLVAKGSRRIRAYVSRKPGVVIEQYDLCYYSDAALKNLVRCWSWSSVDTVDISKKIEPGVTYYFFLRVHVEGVEGRANCNVVTANTVQLMPVKVTATPFLQASKPAVAVKWTPNASVGFQRYGVYYSTSPGVDTLSTLGSIIQEESRTADTITGLQFGATCYLRVFSWDPDTCVASQELKAKLASSLYGADSLIVRRILDTNGLSHIPVDSVSDSANGRIVVFKPENIDLKTLPGIVGELEMLDTLKIITIPNLASLPREIGNLDKVEGFALYQCPQLEHLPDEIGQMSGLRRIWISYLPIRELPNGICNSKSLTHLYLNRCSLKTFPDSIHLMTGLGTINAQNCRIDTLPNALGRIPNLHTLQLYNNELKSLPDTLFSMPGLHTLNVISNPLDTISPAIGKAKGLASLNISSCPIRVLPEEIDQTNLWSLVADYCLALTSLPGSMKNLSRLDRLFLRGCKALAPLSNTIGTIPALKHLKLPDIGLQTLPENFVNLNLSTCELKGNSLCRGNMSQNLQNWVDEEAPDWEDGQISGACND